MLRLKATACIDAPIEQVWAALSDLEGITRWVPAIRRAHCEGARRGEGAVRVCELDQATIRETLVEWHEGRSFRYRGQGAPMMADAFNRWSVEAQGHKTLVTSEAEVVLKGGPLGRLMEPLVGFVARRAGARSLASLKYLVEQGAPHPGGPLKPAPSSC